MYICLAHLFGCSERCTPRTLYTSTSKALLQVDIHTYMWLGGILHHVLYDTRHITRSAQQHRIRRR